MPLASLNHLSGRPRNTALGDALNEGRNRVPQPAGLGNTACCLAPFGESQCLVSMVRASEFCN